MRFTATRGQTIAVCAVCLCALSHVPAVRGAAPRSSRLAIAMDEAHLTPLPQRPRRKRAGVGRHARQSENVRRTRDGPARGVGRH